MKYRAKYTYHGKWTRKEYFVWSNMKNRCTNKNCDKYEYYGGRGIQVCARWQKSFVAFLEDVGERPSLQHSLDRIDNDGNYEPGNVRWATRFEQMNNQRELQKDNKSGYRNISWHKSKKRWVVKIRRQGQVYWLGAYKEIHDAINARDMFKLNN